MLACLEDKEGKVVGRVWCRRRMLLYMECGEVGWEDVIEELVSGCGGIAE